MPDTSASAHFFTSLNTLTQSEAQKFGPVSPDVFRITSSFNANGAKAIAVCKAVVLVVHQNASTVNLVLKPFKQPFPGLNIKYFIYRGLKKSDFFNGDAVASGTASEFIKQIKDDYQVFIDKINNANPPINPAPDILPLTPKSIGYDPGFDAEIPLSDFFYKESDFVSAGDSFGPGDEFELPVIAAGKTLGHFNAANSGIDVVLHYGDYKHNFDNGEFDFSLGYAALAEVKIELTGLTDAEKKLKREQSTQFIDIAAFYGLFAPINAKVEVMNGENREYRTSNAIYTDVLTPFVTKNFWYIYIQGDRTRSYNFYENYKIADNDSHPMKAGTAADSLTAIDYGTNGWPVLINDQTTAGSASENSYYIQFATDNNPNTALFGQLGKIVNAKQNNFCDAEDLKLPADNEGNEQRITKVIQLSTMAVAEGSNMRNIAALSIVLYQGVAYTYIAGQELDEDDETVDILATPNFFDDVFDLIKTEPLLRIGEDTTFSKMASEKLKLVNHYYDGKIQGTSAVKTTSINDEIDTNNPDYPKIKRVTYDGEVTFLMSNPVSPSATITTNIQTTTSANNRTGFNEYIIPPPYYYELKRFKDNGITIKGLLIKATDGSTPCKIILGISKIENDILKDLITNNSNIKNPRLFMVNPYSDGRPLISSDNVRYQKYNVVIVAENSGVLNSYIPTEPVIVYSLDEKYYFSKTYSDNMKEYYPENDKTIIINENLE